MKPLAEMLVFVRVVEAGGMSAAARELGQTTSTVSRSIARLESFVGGALLMRGGAAMTMTELGAAVFAGSSTIARTLVEVETLARRYTSEPSGRLRVSLPVALAHAFLIPRLPSFMARFPDLELDLDLSDRIVDVLGESFDAAIRISDSLPPGLVARPLGRSTDVLVASTGYLGRTAPPQTPDELARHCVLGPSAPADGALVLRSGTTSIGVVVPQRITLNDPGAVLAAVRSHVAIGLLPDYAALDGLRTGELVRVLPRWKLACRCASAIHALYPPTRQVSRKMRAFIDFLVEHREALGGAGQTD